MAAWRALGSPADSVSGFDCVGNLVLEPEELLELLDQVAFCPSFSSDLYQPDGPLVNQLFCSEDAFGGDRRRRQYFRNHMLHLHCEKAVQISQTLASLADHEYVTEAAVIGVRARNEDDDPDEGSSDQDQDDFQDGNKLVDGRRQLVVVIENKDDKTEFLATCAKKDLFLVRPLSRVQGGATEEQRSLETCENARLDAAEGASPPVWIVGEATLVSAPPNSRLSLLELSLYPPANAQTFSTNPGDKYQILPINFIPSVFKRQKEAVRDLCDCDERFDQLIQRHVFPDRPGSASTEDGADKCDDDRAEPGREERGLPNPKEESEAVLADDAHLNTQQGKAVEAAAGREPLTLIQGPPGTGKTAVAVSIVEAWLRQDPETPILVATGTHVARNLIARRLVARGVQISDRRDIIMNRTPPVGSVPVFVETVYMAAIPEARSLPRVVIDESSQITEVAALVALGHGCTKLVLIGDPKQLGPVSNLGSLAFTNPEQSPFAHECESVFELMRKRHDLAPVVLNEQYRMSQRLCKYPSEHFYAGVLATSKGKEDASPPPGFSPFTLLQHSSVQGTLDDVEEGSEWEPTVFVDTSSLEGRSEELVPFRGGFSWRNCLEARIVERIVRALRKSQVCSGDISLLTSYGAQRDHLAKVLHGADAVRSRCPRQRSTKLLLQGVDILEEEPHPRVHTIDGFQGSENDIIVFSAVRSNQSGATGFVGHPQRLCVLLTRARRGLIVVGDSSTLRQDKEWHAWLDGAPKQVVLPAPLSDGERESSSSLQ